MVEGELGGLLRVQVVGNPNAVAMSVAECFQVQPVDGFGRHGESVGHGTGKA